MIKANHFRLYAVVVVLIRRVSYLPWVDIFLGSGESLIFRHVQNNALVNLPTEDKTLPKMTILKTKIGVKILFSFQNFH